MQELFGVIGNPIRHSLSPLIQNQSYQLNNIDAHFQAFHVEEENLEHAIKGLKAIGVKGFMVTVPFKNKVLPYLDEVSETAKKIQAVNVVHLFNGKYIGYNFDGRAWLSAVEEDMEINELTSQNVLLVGAGGAAQSIYYSLSQYPNVKIDIGNRTKEKADNVRRLNLSHKNTDVISLDEAEARIDKYDLLVQTTSIGMFPNVENTPINISSLKKDAFASDIIYNPKATEFLKQAKEAGAQIQNGMKMLASQNVLCIKKWTNNQVDVEEMLKTLEEHL
ncbi:shikimate dehydrogenase [Oceanobacillus oncorhynchi subsp. oncorhynchi]|uniref:shikimate dehydrogenase n=1 Tax=Oceanobacillus oncorhynchi TaxID=545501 RepID=UPI0031DAD00F